MTAVHSGEFFETKVRYEKMADDGSMKKVTENYVVDALSFTEAEKRITEEMSSYISGEYQVVGEKIAKYSEVLTSEGDIWYKFRIKFITLDEKTGKEKKTYQYYLVQSASVDKAKKVICEHLNYSMIDWEIFSVSETNFLDVFFYGTKKETESEADSESK